MIDLTGAKARRVTLEEAGKPWAKYVDFTSGNRVVWRKWGYDSPLVVFVDKEPGLLRPPDVLAEWRNVDKIFAPDTFRLGWFDPPHTWIGETSLHNNPRSRDSEDNYTGMWWGNGGSRDKLTRDIAQGQRSIARVTPLLFLKWNETSIPLNRILTCFTEWEPKRILRVESRMKRGKSDTYWVKLVRR